MMLKTQGIVLEAFDYQENSKIVKVFTKEFGIISILQRIHQNFSHSLSEPFTKYNFILKKGKSFYYIQDLDLIKSRLKLKIDIQRNSFGILISDFIKSILYEEIILEKIYQLYDKTLDFLEVSKEPIHIVNGFLIKFVAFTGYQPNIKYDPTNNKLYSFSISAGGLIDPNIDQQRVDFLLNLDELNYLNFLLYNNLENIDNLIIKNSVSNKILDLLIEFLLNTFSIYKFKSIEFIRYLRK